MSGIRAIAGITSRTTPVKLDAKTGPVGQSPSDVDARTPWRRWTGGSLGRGGLLVLGLFLGQAVLFGPSLAGWKVLLPLDILAQRQVYVPLTLATANVVVHNPVLSDLVYIGEPGRIFSAGEVRAGRWPLWNPYQFAGVPFTGARYSPFTLLLCLWQSPMVLAWVQFVQALVTGTGMYFFCRRVLRVRFWPAIVTAWCYPLSGYFVFWQGYGLPYTVTWFPWLLLAVDKTVRGASRWAGPALALVTALVVVSGMTDVAGQMLLASGIYAIWCYFDAYGHQWRSRRALAAVAALVVGWALGFLLSLPHLLPLIEYTHSGSRMIRRSRGEEERPPVGLAALAEIVLPDVYGTSQRGSWPMFPAGQPNQLESASATYTGLLATLLLAPLAWCGRRHRSVNLLWLALAFVALSWVLDVPGMVTLLRMPGLNMMSHNRFVFAASFSLLALAAVGMESLAEGTWQRRWWFWIPATVLAGICVWSAASVLSPPEPMLGANPIEEFVRQGHAVGWITGPTQVQEIRDGFSQNFLVAAILSGLGTAAWLMLWSQGKTPRWFLPVLGVTLVADLLWFGYGRSSQCDWSLYYPRIPVLDKVATSTPGRIIGFQCLPAALAQTQGLRDVRGYDAVDPARFIDLMALVKDPRTPKIRYAVTQGLIPTIDLRPPGIVRLHPVLDMLNVRYVIFRGSPPKDVHPDFIGDDYWALTNAAALPRAFVPRHVETVADQRTRLSKLADANFDPREVAYVETSVNIPTVCRGSAEIVDEIPTKVTVSVKMETPGVLVLADLWDQGWNAYRSAQRVPILRTNHAVRGVELPAGNSIVEFRYEPASLVWGLRLSGLALVSLFGWLGVVYLQDLRKVRSRALT